jgi:hypothetical protein
MRQGDSVARDFASADWWHVAAPFGGGAEPKIDSTGQAVQKSLNPLARIVIPNTLVPNPTTTDRTLREWAAKNPDEAWFPEPPSGTIVYKDQSIALNATALRDYRERAGRYATTALDGKKIPATEAGVEFIRNIHKAANARARDEIRAMISRKGVAAMGEVK